MPKKSVIKVKPALKTNIVKAIPKKATKKAVKKSVPSSSSVPTLVKTISILFYIAAVSSLLIGVILVVGGIVGGSIISGLEIDTLLEYSAEQNQIDAYLIPIILGSLVVGGLIVIAFGIFQIFIARGLWKGRNWARIVVIILMVIGFLGALAGIDIFTLIITGLIGGYLWFGKGPKAAFSK